MEFPRANVDPKGRSAMPELETDTKLETQRRLGASRAQDPVPSSLEVLKVVEDHTGGTSCILRILMRAIYYKTRTLNDDDDNGEEEDEIHPQGVEIPVTRSIVPPIRWRLRSITAQIRLNIGNLSVCGERETDFVRRDGIHVVSMKRKQMSAKRKRS
ncbi:hypothetical protein C8R42DRAFT_638200 [Lentinula raphanica]|nr:hypothetical protein C8R42DRAFT_638200 [Lentinula raphanica]